MQHLSAARAAERLTKLLSFTGLVSFLVAIFIAGVMAGESTSASNGCEHASRACAHELGDVAWWP